jgi:Flp pilus assembly protein TadD
MARARVRVGGTRRPKKAAARILALCLLGLTSCETTPALQLDPLATRGRDGGTQVTYPAVMRVAAAARSGGDYANAVALYRHAETMAGGHVEPLIELGATLLDMGQIDEAIVSFNQALAISPHAREALFGLAKAYLKTGRPELANTPLAIAYQDNPRDPKLLLLIGVADDFVGQHGEAQARYRAGLELTPADPSLTLDLALSLALSQNFDQAIALLRPIAMGPRSRALDRQTLALVYGLQGDQQAARRFAQVDLDAISVEHNLAFYESLRHLPPDDRSRAILSASAGARVSPQF